MKKLTTEEFIEKAKEYMEINTVMKKLNMLILEQKFV